MYEKITLSSLKDGAVEERFQYELKKVLDNIADPNTETKKARKITIELTFSPDESCENVSCITKVKSSLVPVKESSCILSLSSAGENLGLYQETTKQFNFPEKKSNEILLKEAVNG